MNQFANKGATLEELADFLAKQIPPILSCTSASVHLLDKEKNELLVYFPKNDQKRYKKIEAFLGVSIPKLKLSLETISIYANLISDKKERILTEKKELKKLVNDYLNAAPFPPQVKKKLAPLLPALIPIIGREKVHLIPILSGDHAIGLLELSYDKKTDQSNSEKIEEVLQQVSTIFSRKLSEVELAQLHRQQKLILDSAAEGILGMDMKGKHIFVNPAAAEMLGYEVDELLQKKSHQLYHRGFEEHISGDIDDCPIYQHTDLAKQAEEKTTFFYRKDGSSFPISYTNSPIMEEGKAIGVVMAFRDISKQVEARREIARLAQVVEQARISVGIMDLEGKGIYVNPFVEKTTGYKKEDFLGKDLKIPFDSTQNKEVYEKIWERITSGKNWEGNLIHKKSDGSLYTEDANIFPVKDDEGEIINYAYVKRNISAEVEANKALKEEKDFSEKVIDTSTAIIVGLDKDHIVRLFNKGAEDITGYKKEDALGKDWFALAFKPEIATEMNKVWNNAWGADAHAYINPIWVKNGEKRIISWQTTGFYENLPKERQMLLSIGEDITERVHAEEETKQTRDELARLYRASGALLAGTTPSLNELGRRIVETVLFEFEHSNCSLILTDDNSLNLKRVAVAGTYAKEVSQSTLTIKGQGLVPEVIRKGIVINSPNVTLRKNYKANWEAARSEMAIPLIVGKKTIGAIDVQSPEKNAFSTDDQRLLVAFAERAALAIENIRLYEDAKRRLGRLGALHTIDVAIASADNNQTVEVIAEQAQKELKVDAVSILVRNPSSESFECLARRGFQTEALVYTNLAMGEGLAGQAASKRQIIRIDNLDEKSPSANTPELVGENFVSYWGIPLISKDKVNGVLEIFHRKTLSPNAEWESFLNTLAGQAAIAIDNASLFTDLQKSNQDLRLAYDSTLEGWARALELRDMETEGHSRRVTKLTTELATAMGIDSRKIEHVHRGALLHDVGKMGIPDSILHKPGPLTDEEWAIMRQHTIYAYEMLKNIPFLVPALDIPRYHHEKWDGSGYPEGLSGEAIPLPARICAIIDVYDALTNVRPYREAWSKEKALAYIKEGSGTHFDPKVVKAFRKIILKKDWGE